MSFLMLVINAPLRNTSSREVAPLQDRSAARCPCIKRPCAVSVICGGVGVVVAIGVEVGVAVAVAVAVGVGLGVGVAVAIGVEVGVA